MTAVQAPTTNGWRIFRASVFAVLATQLAALGHALGGGSLPDPAVLITVTVFLGGSLSGLARNRRTGPQIFAVLVVSQLAFHAVFAVTAEHAGHAGTGSTITAAMLAFHLFAALATSILMAGGESTLFRLFAALHRALVPALPIQVVQMAPGWTAVITGGSGGLRLRAGELLPLVRRGPPLAA